MSPPDTPQSSRARGRAKLRNLTALTAVVGVAGVAGIAVAVHSAAGTSSSSKTSDSQGDSLQSPSSNPESTQQQPLAQSNGS